jgi:hypothetical protein
VATKQVNIDILAKDKTQKAMQSATKGVNKLKDNVQQSVAHQQKSFNALGNTVRNVVGGVIVYQALRFGKQMVNMASAVEEMQSKSSVVFGRFVESVRGELEKFGDAVGRSTFELEGMASSIQDTFVPMGFARGEASKLAVQLTKLAVDVASFNNASDVETMMAFQSALVGNHETVRRFGVVITEATLKQELLRMGINKTADEITNAEKVQARLNLIIAGTADAQGDAERTSGSFANSSKALSSALDELTVTAITPMLPALTGIVIGLTNAVKATEDFLRVIGLIPKDLSTVIKQNEEISRLYDKEAEILERLDKVVDKRAKNTLTNELKVTRNLIQSIKDMQTADAQARAGKERSIIISRTNAKVLADEAEALKKLKNQQALPIPRPANVTGLTGPEMGIRGVDIQAISGGINFDDSANQLREQFDNEIAIHQEMFEKKYSLIQDNNELLAELDRIRADEKLRLAYETAQKEKEISKKAFDDNFNLIKSGKAGEINLEKLTNKDKVDLAKKVGGEALEQLAQHNKKAFMLNKAYKIAEAISNTAMGVTEALKLGPIFGPPLALAIGALGAVQVATIASTKFQGRRLGGRMNQDQPYMVGEAGPELVVPDKASNVVPNGQLGNMGKQVNVNFHITTVDATGFSELLVNSRATIVNVINQALNEKGKEVLV